MNQTEGALAALLIILLLGGIVTGAIFETIQDHEYRMAQLACAPKVCRTEHGHRKECDND